LNVSCKQGVWGCARPRQLHGLLGPSGAGKSTLLDLLTMRLHNENCTGQLHINGAPITQQQLANNSVYVPQVGLKMMVVGVAGDAA
jgi:ABC-type multidrug transport system ATPase subunit